MRIFIMSVDRSIHRLHRQFFYLTRKYAFPNKTLRLKPLDSCAQNEHIIDMNTDIMFLWYVFVFIVYCKQSYSGPR